MPYKDADARRRANADSMRRRRARLRGLPADGPLPAAPDEDELLRLLGQRARSGSVTATMVLWRRAVAEREAREKVADPLSGLDDLARARAKRSKPS